MKVQYLNIDHLYTSINNIIPTLKHIWSMGAFRRHYIFIHDFSS